MSKKPGIAHIMIDTRESAKHVVELAIGQATVTHTDLPGGDIWLVLSDGEILVFERKTPTDFVNSVKSGRIFAEAQKCLEVSRHSYLLLEGQLSIFRGYAQSNVGYGWSGLGMSGSSVVGAIHTLQQVGMMYVWCENPRSLPHLLKMVAGADRRSLNIKPIKPAKKQPRDITFLSALSPLIGATKAQALLDEHGHALEALLSLQQAKNTAYGVGKKIHEDVVRFLGLENRKLVVEENGEPEQAGLFSGEDDV